jgi:hypothetical protein
MLLKNIYSVACEALFFFSIWIADEHIDMKATHVCNKVRGSQPQGFEAATWWTVWLSSL